MRFYSALKVCCLSLAVLLQISANAHTGLRESLPADGAMLKTEPNEIHLVFSGPVKLIKLELMGVGHEMPTAFEPNSDAQSDFVIATPGMHPGKFTVNWAAIGADGHNLTDSFSFEVDPTLSNDTAAP
jgi:methionine-rich copper-binding protein CopC